MSTGVGGTVLGCSVDFLQVALFSFILVTLPAHAYCSKWSCSIKCVMAREMYQTPGVWNSESKSFDVLMCSESQKKDISLYENVTEVNFDAAFTIHIQIWILEIWKLYQTFEIHRNVFEYALKVSPNTDQTSISLSNSFFLSLLLPPGQL